jgi:hypothetical protein
MIATGVCLSLTISCKMVGLFTFFTIGAAVVYDLWNMLDIRRGHSMVRSGLDVGVQITYWSLSGLHRSTFLRPRCGPHRHPGHRVPILVLGALCRPHQKWDRRRLYESPISRVAHWEPLDDRFSRLVACNVLCPLC